MFGIRNNYYESLNEIWITSSALLNTRLSSFVRKAICNVEQVFAFLFFQAVVALTFAVFISDFKRKIGMVPLISEKWTYALKLLLLVPLFVYAYALITLPAVLPFDLFSFGLTLLGTVLVVKAKVDLARHHTWTGFCMDTPKLVAHGIYAYMRHPLYAGVYLFVSGLTLTVVLHASWCLVVPAGLALVYILSFLAVSASRETIRLEKKLGREFTEYKRQVHFCLPLRKYAKQKHA
jgi:protein-S-isoprenylcysteine O-methyltransferase Ste14